MANYLVTGGAGFIGSHLVARLVELDHTVRVIDDFSSGKRENLAPILDRIHLLDADIRDPEQCLIACDDIDTIFHQAAVPSVPKSVDQPMTSHDVNINGTFNIFIAARTKKCRRVVYAASSSAYGESAVSPKHEAIMPEPLSPYAVQKLTGELYGRAFYECFGLESFSLRYFNVFGPRQDPKSQYAAAIPAFVTALLNDEPPTVYGDGLQTRDFTHVDNVVHANILAADAPHAAGQALNIACGCSITVNDVIQHINRLLEKSITPNYVPARTGDVKHSHADITLARKLIGFEPQVDFQVGLRRALDYYTSLAR